jgi:mercuric ion binding protein
MKKIILVLLFFAGIQIKAQVVTTTLTVKGNCHDCKKRIENAADIHGVKSCEWNDETRVATITYNSAKVGMPEIEEAIAKHGYDTENVRADEKAYSKLPKCCQYRTQHCTDKDK